MKISLKWLRSYVPAGVPVAELAHKLTMAGVEVADFYRIGESWEHVYVGEVATLQPHPNADRLQLATVNYGEGRQITVVTGARNFAVGDKVPLALVGAQLVDTHVDPPVVRELKPVKLRGIQSEGMVCSAKELGLGEDHAGILILDREAPVGAPLASELGDVILDLDVTPNRVDCFSLTGVAREVSALLDEPLTLPAATYDENGPPASSLIEIEVADPDLCPRYTASIVQGLTIGPSPKWLRDRLTAAGLRSINNVVDVTNYVMLEWGQPLHAFDYDKVRGGKIIVRRAGEQEPMTLLDGSEHHLASTNLVIADTKGPIGVAGVMGGANSEVTPETRNIVLESANFQPLSVRRTARSLKMLTDAAHRFERGLPCELTVPAVRRATQLLLETAGGTAAKGLIDVYPAPAAPTVVRLTQSEVRRILGIAPTLDEMTALLERVGCTVTRAGDELRVSPPLQRTDLNLPADLCEEIARMIGYDALPSTLPMGEPPEPTINEEWLWKETLRETLAGLGLSEIVSYALTSRERLGRLLGQAGRLAGGSAAPTTSAPAAGSSPRDLGQAVGQRFAPLDVEPLELLNPLSRDGEALRTTMFGSLLEAVRNNLRVADRDVLLFEIARTYVPRPQNLPEERNMLTIGAGAYRSGTSWGQRVENDFFWLKGVAEVVLDRLNLGERSYRPVRHPIFHPTRAAAIVRPGSDGDQLIGILGEVEPDVRAAFDLDQPAFLLGLDLDALLPQARRTHPVDAIPRFPPVVQDLAVIVPTLVPSQAIEELVREAGMPLVKSVDLFDIYQGPPIPDGKINLAYHITYQSPERTLTDGEVATVHRKIEQALVGQLNAELRG
jgi:phenylalanyl-tRNA synthetase beta chain